MAGTLNREGPEGIPLLDEPLSPSKVAALAASIHGSLALSEILRRCRLLLQSSGALGRLSLVQHRANERTATLYCLDDVGSSVIGPKVIAVEPSRLRRCIIEKRHLAWHPADPYALDPMERKHLVPAGSAAISYHPLLLNGKLKGVLVLTFSTGGRLSEEHAASLCYLTQHLALAVENSDIHYMECRRGRQLEMVSEIAKRAVLIEDLDCFLREVAELIRVSFDYIGVRIWTLEPGQEDLQPRAWACKSGGSLPPVAMTHDAIAEECRKGNESICSNSLDPLPDRQEEWGGSASRLAVPIRLRGKLLGVLLAESNRLDAFPAGDVSTMEGVASLIASSYENLRAFTHAQQSKEYMQAILESARHLAVISTDPRGIIFTSSVGSESIFQLPRRDIAGRDILTLFTDSDFRQEIAAYMKNPGVPMLECFRLSQTGEKRDSYLDVTLQRVYDPEKIQLGYLCIIQDVTENVQLEQRLESLSITDELTGLFNRRRFVTAIASEIKRCHRFDRSLALCFMDLDGFKQFNDSRGHLEGDQALKETARLITRHIRSNVDTCYRYGGDEFTIIMPDTSLENAGLVSERIRRQLKYHFDGKITCSIGIASSETCVEADALIEKADAAMYLAKSQKGDRTVVAG